MNDLRERLRAIDPHPTSTSYPAEQVRRSVYTITTAESFEPASTRRHRRRSLFVGLALITVAAGGATAVSASRPVNDRPDPPLAPPIILNGIGPANVVVPDAPTGAKYLSVELACFNGTKCLTVGGGNESVGPEAKAIASRMVRGTPELPFMMGRDMQPLTDEYDPWAGQHLPVLDPRSGVVVDVEPGTHWRLYAAYAGRINPKEGENSNGQTFGIPHLAWPDFVPVVATNGKAGYVNYFDLLQHAPVRLSPTGAEQAPLPVYAFDGTTVLGEADVSKPYR